MPFDTTIANSVFDYSILTRNTAISGVGNVAQPENHITVYPNPSENTQTIMIENSEAEKASIMLVDIQGTTLRNCFTGSLHEGSNTFTVDLNGLAGGLYFYRIEIDKTVTIKKIIKM